MPGSMWWWRRTVIITSRIFEVGCKAAVRAQVVVAGSDHNWLRVIPHSNVLAGAVHHGEVSVSVDIVIAILVDAILLGAVRCGLRGEMHWGVETSASASRLLPAGSARRAETAAHARGSACPVLSSGRTVRSLIEGRAVDAALVSSLGSAPAQEDWSDDARSHINSGIGCANATTPITCCAAEGVPAWYLQMQVLVVVSLAHEQEIIAVNGVPNGAA